MDMENIDATKNALLSLADGYRSQIAFIETEQTVNERALEGFDEETRERIEREVEFKSQDLAFYKRRLEIVHGLLAEFAE